MCKVTQFDTIPIKIGPVVNAAEEVGGAQGYSLTCHIVIGWNTSRDLLYEGLCMWRLNVDWLRAEEVNVAFTWSGHDQHM